MKQLQSRSLIAHLTLAHGEEAVCHGLTKAEIYLLPTPDSVCQPNFREMKMPAGGLLDDTKTISSAAVGYAVGTCDGPHSATPLAYVFSAESLKKRGYQTHSAILPEEVDTADYAADRVVGRVELPTSLSAKYNEIENASHSQSDHHAASEQFPVHARDMFLVGNRLIPAAEWMHVQAQGYQQHLSMAGQRGIV